MSIKPLLRLVVNHQLLSLTGTHALLKPFYQLNYLAATKEGGLFELLLDAPKGFEQLADAYCRDDKAREALEAWLGLGVRLGCLRLNAQGYTLKGLAKKLAAAGERCGAGLASGSSRTPFKVDLANREQTSEGGTVEPRGSGWRDRRKVIADHGSIPNGGY